MLGRRLLVLNRRKRFEESFFKGANPNLVADILVSTTFSFPAKSLLRDSEIHDYK